MTDWPTLIPSALSAIATAFAAVAAFKSLSISREAKQVAERSALAVHHAPATKALTDVVKNLEETLQPFSKMACSIWTDWPRDIGSVDLRKAGGSNPRPLRHVLSNGAEMLAAYGSDSGQAYRQAQRTMWSVIRDGVNGMSESEYEKLLKQADGEYGDFEVCLVCHSPIGELAKYRTPIL